MTPLVRWISSGLRSVIIAATSWLFLLEVSPSRCQNVHSLLSACSRAGDSMGGVAFCLGGVLLLTLVAAAPLFTSGDVGRLPPPVVLTGSQSRVSVDALDELQTRSADAPKTDGYTVVSPAQMSYRVLENQDIVFPTGYYPDFGPGLIVTDYPWSPSGSFTPGLTSPYGTQLDVYNYSSRSFRRFSYNVSLGGGFTWPGEISAVPGPNATYLFTASTWGGEGGPYAYDGQDISWPISNVIDVPRPTGMVPLSLLIPVTGMGFSPNAPMSIDRAWSRSGYDLIARVSVSGDMGNPPQKTFLYFVNLTDLEYLDVTRAHEVPPAMELPWDAPILCCYFTRATNNVLFVAGIRYIA